MSDLGHICLFQAIQVEFKSRPLRVLEEYFVPAKKCTLQDAKRMFKTRFEDKGYSRKHRAIWPDAVRFLDQSGNEVLRYTSWDYLKEIVSKEANQDQAASAA